MNGSLNCYRIGIYCKDSFCRWFVSWCQVVTKYSKARRSVRSPKSKSLISMRICMVQQI
ncbi:hypothetical protein MtrunA17_Chr5g0400071 [Medicago truncatula]|uniref:Uncharacterized protein n=1 Tax=Medicago truncatula TaxID=3880 RepID=A0A396HKK0_MEDTR|nr:hypothetical protein MtrunA17_Chr5g0400071 [Medicago truncatula]